MTSSARAAPPQAAPPVDRARATSRDLAHVDEPANEAGAASAGPYVVGIGASAGGLPAFEALLANLPLDTGMVFVVVSHLGPTDESLLPGILAKVTRMPVLEATHGVEVQANHVYVIPPNAEMRLVRGRLELEPRAAGSHMPIDAFLRSLAIERKNRAIGVILSGSGTDGALGIEAIQSTGGLTFAQDARSAKFDGMPLAALASGCVDFSMPPAEMAVELGRVAGALRVTGKTGDGASLELEGDLKKIFALLRAAHDVDFTFYRHSTIKRRIVRRMVLLKMPTVKEYIQHLRERPVELEALYQDVLIKVTHFFRDPDVFDVLKQHVFPALIAAWEVGAPIRIWVPGCSTGEEAYSIAIALIEVLTAREGPSIPIQIFATDVSESAIERARSGVYIENIALDVSAERLRRFFTKTGKYYQVAKAIRDMCVFAKQDVTHDPPFSRLDLVTCRNVMIYLEPVLQKRVIPVFHYALKPGGFLVLGTSETTGGFTELFSLVDKKNKIYVKSSSPARLSFEFPGGAHYGLERGRPSPPDGKPAEAASGPDVRREADRVVMSRFAPPGVIVNGDLQIVQFRGHTGPYLEPAPGEASLNVLKMAREGLSIELRAAIQKARRGHAAVRVEGVRVRSDGQAREVSLEVIPLHDTSIADGGLVDQWLLILFDELEPKAPARAAPARKASSKGAAVVPKLEQELASAKEYLQAIIEEQEATNEELQSANEELLSSNEELQSINEELETAKEELQSTNEELTTLNEELENRNAELSRVNNDLGNLLASVEIPIVMLSSDLRIRRFTPQAERVLNLIQGDVGRRISDIKPNIDAPDLERLITEVIETGTIREREVRDHEGRSLVLRIRPYRTSENRVDGAVLCLLDMDSTRANHVIRGGNNGDGGTRGPRHT